MSRDEILLAGNVRHPKAVNDIGAPQLETNRPAERNVNLVGVVGHLAGVDVLIANFPPPLMTGYFDGERVGLASQGSRAIADLEITDQQYEKNDDGCDYTG